MPLQRHVPAMVLSRVRILKSISAESFYVKTDIKLIRCEASRRLCPLGYWRKTMFSAIRKLAYHPSWLDKVKPLVS